MRFEENDIVTKGAEVGRVVKRVSSRTQQPYLTVQITNGSRKGSYEFPERGWTVDDGRTADPGRPAHEEECYIGSQEWKQRHHAR